jgi:hypothetical protein
MKRIALLMVLLVVLSSTDACSDGAGTAPGGADAGQAGETPYWMQDDFDPFGKYDETVQITQGRILASFMAFDEGDDEDNNWWTRAYKEHLNVELTNQFTSEDWGPPFDTLVNMAIATDDLPDVISLYTTLAVRAIQGDKVMDLTDLYEYTASQQVKDIYATEPEALHAWDQNGRIYGLADTMAAQGWVYFWTPQSMIDELNGGVVPVTFDEIVAYAEKTKAKTGGYAFDLGSDLGQLGSLGHLYGATDTWIEKDGQLVYGKIQDEMKQVWSLAADWYAKGLLATDFSVKTTEDTEADFANDRFGVVIGGTNTPHGTMGRTWKALHPDDELVAIPMPTTGPNGNDVKMTSAGNYGTALFISKKCEDPAAVMRMFNLTTAIFSDDQKPEFVTNAAYNSGENTGWATFWCAMVMSGRVTDNRASNSSGTRGWQAVLNGSDGSELEAARSFEAANFVKAVNRWNAEGMNVENWEDGWAYWSMYFGGKSWPHSLQMADEGRFVRSPRTGQEVDAEAQNNQNLYAKYIEYATMAIMENNVEQGFNDWVTYFYDNGGTEIVEQVQAQYNGN